jgi:anti-sigma B factor antagonist
MTTTEDRDLSIVIHVDGPDRCVRLAGELDLSSAPALSSCLSDLAEAGHIAVDLTDLSFMSSSGISVLIGAYKQRVTSGRTISLRNPQGTVARVLMLTGVDQVLTIEP